jgi:RNA polymerase sigma factor (sigma-70 family)
MNKGIFLPEESLIPKIKAGDDSALEYVYKKYYPMIAHLIKTNNGNENDAEDIYQDALVAVYQKIKNGELDQINCTLKTYIYSVCRLKWLHKLRHKGKYGEKFIDTYEWVEAELALQEPEDQMPYYQAMRSALEGLGNPCRQILLAFYFEKLSMDEIALRFGYNQANTAKAKKNKCMDKIRDDARKILKTIEPV